MDYFPAFLDVRGKRCLVVGGGPVAARKVALLLRAGARVELVALAINDELSAAVRAGTISARVGAYRTSDLDGAHVVIAATGDRAVNAEISREAQARAIPINAVDDPASCSLIVPALVDRAPLLIAVSSSGAAPVLSRLLRGKLEALLSPRYGELAALCAALRGAVKQSLPNVEARRVFWQEALEGPCAELVLSGDAAGAERAMRELLALHAGTAGQRMTELYLIGVGPGEPDLVSMRAQRLMQRADLVLHDATLPQELLDLCRRDAERCLLSGRLAESLTQVRARLQSLAARGGTACVLGLHDPFRSSELSDWPAQLGAAIASVRVVPGIA